MLGWLYRMIIGRFSTCEHKWAVLHEVTVYFDDNAKRPVGTKYELQCEKCGDIKARKSYS